MPTPAPAPPPPAPPPPAVVPRPAGYGAFGPFEVLPLDPAARAGITMAVDTYLERAVLAPLRSGQPADLGPVLTAAAAGQLWPEARAVLTDEGLPPVPNVAVAGKSVAVDGLVGPDGTAIAHATIDVTVRGTTAGGAPVRSTRRGVLYVVPEAGGWRIDSFDLTVERDL